MDNKPNPRVGVACFLVKPNGQFLVSRRKGSHGAGRLQLPGGHLEYGESFEECAAREILEETGVKIDPSQITFMTCTNDPMPEENKHYITVFMRSKVPDTVEPKVRSYYLLLSLHTHPNFQTMEPHKCDGWSWMSFETLKTTDNLFIAMQNLLLQRPDIIP